MTAILEFPTYLSRSGIVHHSHKQRAPDALILLYSALGFSLTSASPLNSPAHSFADRSVSSLSSRSDEDARLQVIRSLS